MARPSRTLAQFNEFAVRFVRLYWQDVADNVDKLPPYEGCKETVDELLGTIRCTTSRETTSGQPTKVYVLRMIHTSGSTWRFVFEDTASGWNLRAAVANDETDEHRVDPLDNTYGEIFRPILARVTDQAHTP